MTPPPPEGAPPDPAPPVDTARALAAIDVTHLNAGWRSGPPVLMDVTLRVAPGGTLVVHGGPGAGKSTLLHVLRAAMAPRGGVVTLLGSDVTALPARLRRALRGRIGHIAQTPRLSDDDTTFTAVAAPLLLGPPALRARAEADVADILAYLGLAGLRDEPVGALSEGHHRLIAVARAFVAQPDIVLADEPLAGLNGDAMSRVLRLLSEVARQRAAVVIATQSPDLFAALPAQKLRLERGRIAP